LPREGQIDSLFATILIATTPKNSGVVFKRVSL
jgi:hypothetical protein